MGLSPISKYDDWTVIQHQSRSQKYAEYHLNNHESIAGQTEAEQNRKCFSFKNILHNTFDYYFFVETSNSPSMEYAANDDEPP